MVTSETGGGRTGEPVAEVEPLRLFVLDSALVHRLREVLIAIWSLLAVGGVLSVILVHAVGTELARDVGGFLSLGSELAPGTWVASTMLLACSALAVAGALVARTTDRRWMTSWLVLAATFGVLSLDEVANIHERVSPRIGSMLGNPSGVLTFAWIVPAVVLGIAFLVVEIPLLRHLGAAGRRLVAAGVVFVLGAVGFEMIQGDLTSSGDRATLAFDALVVVEELLEFAAVMWAAVILLEHLRRVLADPDVVLQPGRRTFD